MSKVGRNGNFGGAFREEKHFNGRFACDLCNGGPNGFSNGSKKKSY